jgi:hypothetical protein
MADFFETLGSINPLRPDNMARTGLETAQGLREIKVLLDQGKEREAYARFEELPLQTQVAAYQIPAIGQALSGIGALEYSQRAQETEGLQRAGNVAVAALEGFSTLPLVGLFSQGGKFIVKNAINILDRLNTKQLNQMTQLGELEAKKVSAKISDLNSERNVIFAKANETGQRPDYNRINQIDNQIEELQKEGDDLVSLINASDRKSKGEGIDSLPLSKRDQENFMQNIVAKSKPKNINDTLDVYAKQIKEIARLDDEVERIAAISKESPEYIAAEKKLLQAEEAAEETFNALEKVGSFKDVNSNLKPHEVWGRYVKYNDDMLPKVDTDELLKNREYKLLPEKFAGEEAENQIKQILKKNLLIDTDSRLGLDDLRKIASPKSKKILDEAVKQDAYYLDSPGRGGLGEQYYEQRIDTKYLFDEASLPVREGTALPFEKLAKFTRGNDTFQLGKEGNPLFVDPVKLDELITTSTNRGDYYRGRLRGHMETKTGKLTESNEAREFFLKEVQELSEKMIKTGYSAKNPIFVEVSRTGDVLLPEGNHRLALALLTGQSEIPIVLRYTQGAERLKTNLSVDKIDDIVKGTGFKNADEMQALEKEVNMKIGGVSEKILDALGKRQGLKSGGIVDKPLYD